LQTIFRNDIIKELVYKDYKDSLDYWYEEFQKVMKEKDELSFEFSKLGNDRALKSLK